MTRYQELDCIAESNSGVLLPEQVVEYARNPETALHRSFEWDDSEAAQKYRIVQAQEVIRCYCVDFTAKDKKVRRVRAYTSLPSLRGEIHPYRKTMRIMESPEWKGEMLQQALKELSAFREKYEILEALAPLFAEFEKIVA